MGYASTLAVLSERRCDAFLVTSLSLSLSLVSSLGTVTGGMSTDGSRITPEGSQKLTLLAEGSPPQMMKGGGGGGGVRTHGGIDRPGNKNTTAMSQGNSKKMGRNNNNNNIGKHDILEHPNTEKFKV